MKDPIKKIKLTSKEFKKIAKWEQQKRALEISAQMFAAGFAKNVREVDVALQKVYQKLLTKYKVPLTANIMISPDTQELIVAPPQTPPTPPGDSGILKAENKIVTPPK